MSMFRGSRATLVALAGLILLAVIGLVMVITGSGLLPGDNGVEPVAAAAGANSSGGLMNLSPMTWTMVILLATVALGGAIAWGQYRSGRTNRYEREAAEAATRALHRQERDPSFKD